jgi:flagellar L-ring protein FlgH
MRTPILGLIAAALVALATPVAADTLYVAGPPPSAPGHPLRLGADHRAGQVGDILQVVFNFSASTSATNATSGANSYSGTITPGTGLANLPLLRLGLGLGANNSVSMNAGQALTQAFTSQMAVVVTNVLPSGALVIAGDQKLIVNGTPQSLHVTGVVRPDDITNADTVLSTQVANVEAKFNGLADFSKSKGLLQKIVQFLF